MKRAQTESASSSGSFPTPIAPTLRTPLVQLARLLLKKIGELPDSPEFAAAKAANLALTRQLIQSLYLSFSAPDEAPLHQRIHQARSDANITVDVLAALSGVSVRQIHRVEADNEKVSEKTRMALATVGKLGLVPKEVLQEPTDEEVRGNRSTFYIAQGFDTLSLHNEMKRLINSNGGELEQTHVYLDHESSADWIALCGSPEYVALTRLAFPHRQAAIRLAQLVGSAAIDLVMLGSGDGQTEVRFTQQLLAETVGSSISLHLLDASLPLLNKAFGHAILVLGPEPRILIHGVQGSFHDLSHYCTLSDFRTQPHRRRVFSMFGGTIGNLDNEVSFFRRLSANAVAGDLLILDQCRSFSDVNGQEQPWQADPALKAPVPEAHRTWLRGPIKRYCRNVEEVELTYRIDSRRPIPGSYGLQFVAHIKLEDGKMREFVAWNVRRYNLDKLSEAIQSLGWAEVGRFPFSETARPQTLLMFQRQ